SKEARNPLLRPTARGRLAAHRARGPRAPCESRRCAAPWRAGPPRAAAAPVRDAGSARSLPSSSLAPSPEAREPEDGIGAPRLPPALDEHPATEMISIGIDRAGEAVVGFHVAGQERIVAGELFGVRIVRGKNDRHRLILQASDRATLIGLRRVEGQTDRRLAGGKTPSREHWHLRCVGGHQYVIP